MDTKANTPVLADKSFWLVIVGLIVTLLNKRFGLDLNATEIASLLATIAAFVLGNKWKSGQITLEEIRAQSAKDAIAALPLDAQASWAAGALSKIKPSTSPSTPTK